ncbi:MAG: hypothetical protein HY226_06540 [Candidatus Vogelbacteria bacterium]|nr:hypothetical protein [Candidatus Vogelbacteria bacterium]
MKTRLLTFVSLLLIIMCVSIKLMPEELRIKGRRFLAESFVKKNLREMIGLQEKRFGIKYQGMPKILYTNLGRGSVSSYSADDSAIYLSTDTTYLTITDNDGLNWSIGLLVGVDRQVNLRTTLNHELVHFYIDKYIHKVPENILQKLNPKSAGNLDELMNRLVQEGIADYIQDGMSIEKKKVSQLRSANVDADYFTEHTNDFYSIALELVKPVIDIYKVRGIEYLITHSLDGTRLKDLRGFQKKALEELAIK